MDRLLELLLEAIRAPGNPEVHHGARFCFHRRRRLGPAGRHPLHDQGRAARRAARSRAQARRSLHGRHVAGGGRHDRRPARDRARPDQRRHAAELGAAAMVVALFLPTAAAVQSCRRARAATSRITTISTAGSIRCSSTPTGNTPAPISKRPTSRSTMPNSPRSAISPPSSCVEDGPARARHRLRLGRACALSRRILPRPRHRRHAVAGAMAARQRARGRKEPDRHRSISACRTIATCGKNSTASSRSACSSTSA